MALCGTCAYAWRLSWARRGGGKTANEMSAETGISDGGALNLVEGLAEGLV